MAKKNQAVSRLLYSRKPRQINNVPDKESHLQNGARKEDFRLVRHEVLLEDLRISFPRPTHWAAVRWRTTVAVPRPFDAYPP